MTWLWILIPVVILLLAGGGKQRAKEPRKSGAGHWIYHPHVMKKDDYECSRCHARLMKESLTCPRCGTRMTGKTEKSEDEWLDEEETLDLLLDDD